jgi:hypothetical protein
MRPYLRAWILSLLVYGSSAGAQESRLTGRCQNDDFYGSPSRFSFGLFADPSGVRIKQGIQSANDRGFGNPSSAPWECSDTIVGYDSALVECSRPGSSGSDKLEISRYQGTVSFVATIGYGGGYISFEGSCSLQSG